MNMENIKVSNFEQFERKYSRGEINLPIKVFISTPYTGLTNNEFEALLSINRITAIATVSSLLPCQPDDIDICDMTNICWDEMREESPVKTISYDIGLMGDCDIHFLGYNWYESTGCHIEEYVSGAYHMPSIKVMKNIDINDVLHNGLFEQEEQRTSSIESAEDLINQSEAFTTLTAISLFNLSDDKRGTKITGIEIRNRLHREFQSCCGKDGHVEVRMYDTFLNILNNIYSRCEVLHTRTNKDVFINIIKYLKDEFNDIQAPWLAFEYLILMQDSKDHTIIDILKNNFPSTIITNIGKIEQCENDEDCFFPSKYKADESCTHLALNGVRPSDIIYSNTRLSQLEVLLVQHFFHSANTNATEYHNTPNFIYVGDDNEHDVVIEMPIPDKVQTMDIDTKSILDDE